MIELAELFRRDLTRLMQELQAFNDEEALWRISPGVSNSAGNLTLHLEGNLREYIGRQLGRVPYTRQRSLEFSLRDIPAAELTQRIEAVKELVPGIVAGLTPAELQSTYPEMVFGAPISTLQLLLSLYGHLNYHMGQIDYLRRVLTGGAKIEFAGL
ncbi:MAG: DinB family protein [Candidatus Solibacter usitatus]|nr:DinB family protein [Candidatus Solibacter usitatus]